MVDQLEHIPARPGYDCAACGQPWPCAPAKVALSEEYEGNSPGLAVYLGNYLHEALEEAVHAHDWRRVDDMYDRFMGWVSGCPRHRRLHGGWP